MKSILENFNELFLSNEKNEKNRTLAMSLLPNFIGCLSVELASCIALEENIEINSFDKRLKRAFRNAHKGLVTEDCILNCFEHDFLNPGGYFYEMGFWFESMFLLGNFEIKTWTSHKCGAITLGDTYQVANYNGDVV